MSHDLNLRETKKEWHGTFQAYIIGFLISFLLTATSFFLVIAEVFSAQIVIYTVVSLAIIQAIVQLLFFFHLGKEETKPRWASMVFIFTILILLIVVIGSLWIMNDLDHRMMLGME